MEKIEQFLKDKDIRPTAMRMLIYRHLEKNKFAVTLTDIENSFSKIDRTTLYRTLKTFEEKAVVHQIDDGTGVSKYALCKADCNCELEQHLHLHFYCYNCDETSCLTDYKVPHINLPEGFVAENANVVLKGICSKCSKL